MSVPRRGAAPIVTGSSPGGCSANALDITTAERVRAPPQQLLMVAKCSVMVGGHQVSSRRLLGRPGPKSGSAGSRWRPQHTRKSRAARAMTPVLQDKPHHSTDLAELVPTNILHYYLLFYCALCGKRPRTCRISLGGPEDPLSEERSDETEERSDDASRASAQRAARSASPLRSEATR